MSAPPRAVVAGGGFGGLEAALYLRERLSPDQCEVLLVSDRPEFIFKPYLNYVPFGLQPEALRFDLAELARARGFGFWQGVAHDAAPDERTVEVNGDTLSYDALFVATGATAGPEPVPGLHAHAFMVGREGDMHRLQATLHQLCSDVKSGARRRIVFLAPPGCQWAGALYELAFMCSTWLGWKDTREGTDLMLLTAEPRFMDAFGAGVHEKLQGELKERGIGARRHQRPERVDDDALVFPGNGRLPYDLLIAAPSYTAAAQWDALPTNAQGFVQAEPATRQVEGDPGSNEDLYDGIYAVGDASDHPVKQGFLALLQADAAAEHWAAGRLDEEPAFAFEPQGTWLMEQFDQALLAEGTLDANAFAQRDPARVERLPVGQMRRILASEHQPSHGERGALNPLYTGLLWKGTETSLKMLRHLTDQR